MNKLIKTNDSLAHFGVKGQKWGIINAEKPKGTKGTKDVVKEILYAATKNEMAYDAKNKITNFDSVPLFNPNQESMNSAMRKINEGYALSPYMAGAVKQNANANGRSANTTDILTFANNSSSAAFAYELRRRGYDVEAGLTGEATIEEFGEAFGISEKEMTELRKKGIPPQSFEDLTKSLEKMGVGARGLCIMSWNSGGTHMCSFEVNAKGKVIFLDAQTGHSSDEPQFKQALKADGKLGENSYQNKTAAKNLKDLTENPAEYYKKSSEFFAVRIDNRPMNKNVVKNWVRVDDKKKPKGEKKLKYIEPPKIQKAKDFVQHNISKSINDLRS